MKAYSFRILNVFTRGADRLSGNPLCVFEDARGLDEDTMQALARQFNLSETTFIFPSSAASARVRIYTPGFEMSFAGHPTLGTAHVCRALGLGGNELTLEMKAGIIPVSAAGNRWTLTARSPTWRELDVPVATLAASLGLTDSDIAERPMWVDPGREQLIVPLASVAAVRRVRLSADALSVLKNSDGQGMAYVFALTGPGKALSRFFFPQGAAIMEDPATGSATAGLGGWWLAMRRPLPWAIEISQGEAVKRPSLLFLTVDVGRNITVSGDVMEIGRGTIDQ
jgi:PhzF family phenazine biosynthesis protein